MPPKKTSTTKPTGTSTTTRKRKIRGDDDRSGEDAKPRKASKKATNSATKNQTEISTQSSDKLEKPVVINRAPVLELWSACVANFLHPELSWNACLGIGGSISTLIAITKGRAIGKVAEPKSDKDVKGKKKHEEEELPTLTVMGFPMTMKGDAVVVKGKERTGREANLSRKFGEENLEWAKETMQKALNTWKGSEDKLDKGAFHMYEKFRPEVAKGQQGWGRKGELHLSKVESVVKRARA